ncbi:MAG: A24 family peptidase [Candidatus Magasanikbacteria bacterium]|jgi:prepilin signal peptidase PulO-like enzyme (type II secretory pathway)
MLDLGSYIVLVGGIVYFFVFVLGLILGSFLNSWMWRVRDNIRILSNSRSMCPNCHYQLRWYENIPLISWLVLRAHCSNCKKPIHWSYFVVELATGFLMMYVVGQHVKLVHFSEWVLLRDVCFLTFLIIIFMYDLRYKIILSRVIWAGTIIGFLINILILNFSASSLLLGMLIGGGFFLIQYIVSSGRWIGGGDIRMGVMMGAWLGWQNTILALFVAYILGAIVGIGLMLIKKADGKTELPFGMFLAVATFITLYYGDSLIGWYLQFLR